MRVSFLVPAYNEAATIVELLERVSALDLDKQIVVVDDGSTDGTGDSPRAGQAAATTSSSSGRRTRGKGAAIRAAIPRIDGDIAVIQDADLEYDPADVPALIEPIERGAADVVFGSRLSGGTASARVPVLAPRGQPLSDAAHERALQHDALRHGDRLQGVPL